MTSPPGSGKTALIASYLKARKLPCLWYKIDEGDADIATFFYYMGVTAKNIAPKKRTALPVFTPEYMQGVSIFSKRYFENFFSRVKTPFTIIFDNYQDVPYDSEFHDMISNGLADVPNGINIIISSRKGPPPQFAYMQINNKIHLVGWDEVRFTIEEVKELVCVKKMKELSDETIRYLHKKTDGWAAGLVLIFESLKREDIDYRLLNRMSSDNIFDYFAHEIFQKLNADTQSFLLKTTFLPTMTVKMAEKLTGIRSSEEILNKLSKDHYFTEIYQKEKSVYHYHPLFREFLLTKAKESFTSNDVSLIKQNAALILEEAGRAEDAVQLFQESGDIQGLSRLIQKWAHSLIGQGRYQTLSIWLDFLPKEFLSSNPWMLYWNGICHLPFNPAESLIQFEIAFHQFNIMKDAAGAFLACAGVIESIMYGHEGLEPLDRWFSVVDELLKEFKGFPSEQIEANVTCSMVRAMALRRPADFDMKKWVDRINKIVQTTTDSPTKTKALINLACYLYSEGKFQDLEIILETLHISLERKDIPPLSRLTIDWVRAAYLNVMSLYDQCMKVVSDGLDLAHMFKINVMEYMLLGHGVLASLKRGDLITAQQYLHRMTSALSFLKLWEASFYHYCSAWEALYQNNLAQALTHSEHCLRLCENSGNPWTLSMAHLLKANVYFAFGETKKSAEHISRARSTGIKSKNNFTLFICLLTEAYLLLKQGKETPALEAIRKGMQMGREKGFVNLFMWQKGVMETIFAKALESRIEEAYAKELIHKNAIVPDNTHIEIENWPWPLKIFTFGRFNILKDGKPVQFSRKVQQRPLSLLKVFVAFGGRAVPEDRVIDVLWPEAEGDAAHSAFTTTLFRLRQLLGIEQAITFQEGKAFLDPRYCWVDVWTFERILGKVDPAWMTEAEAKNNRAIERDKKSEREEAIKLTEKALKMYTGPFLASEHEPWMLSIRERLRNKFLRNVSRLGLYWEQAGKLEKAVECYQKGLEVDDLAEEFYQRLMKCYQKMGKRAEALSVYKRCYQILSSVLSIEPSPETEAIRKALKS